MTETAARNLYPGGVTAEDLRTFVGPRSEKYLGHFRDFAANGSGGYAASWHWPALFIPFLWLLYRKLYLWALVAFVVGLVPFVNLISRVAFALSANYLYYRHATGKVVATRRRGIPGNERIAALAREGGANGLVAVIGGSFMLVAVLGILAAVAVPQYLHYVELARDRMLQGNYDTAVEVVKAELDRAADGGAATRDVVADLNARVEGNPYLPEEPAFVVGSPREKGQVGVSHPDLQLASESRAEVIVTVNRGGQPELRAVKPW